LTETIRLQLDRDVPVRAREWVRALCATSGLDALADDAELMVSELVTNVFLHAHTSCVIKAEPGDHAIKVQVTDEDHTDVRPVSAADGSERGRGLHIVAALSNNWGIQYEPAGKTIWFTLTSAAGVHARSRMEQAPRSHPRSSAAS